MNDDLVHQLQQNDPIALNTVADSTHNLGRCAAHVLNILAHEALLDFNRMQPLTRHHATTPSSPRVSRRRSARRNKC